MIPLEELLDKTKNNLIQYCIIRYKDDELLKKFYTDVQYFEHKIQARIDNEKRKKIN
jgi:hypothetical protein